MVDRQEIKRRRLALTLTLKEAAQRAGMNGRQQWHGIEAGERTNVAADTLWAVARVLGCKMDDLMAQGEPTPATKPATRKRQTK